MSVFNTIKDVWRVWAHLFDEAITAIPGLGRWFRPNWSILIINRDGSFAMPDEDGGQSSLNDEQVRLYRQQKRICLRLGNGLGQQRDIVLPAAARRDPTSMIALSLKQYFPFPEDDTAFTVHSPALPAEANQSRFRVSFARRSHLEETLRRAAQYGIIPKAVDALGNNSMEAVSADLMSGARAGGGKSASTLLAGLCIGLIAITVLISTWSALGLEPQATQLQIRQHPGAIDQALAQQKAKTAAPSILDIWQAATNALPDSAHAEYILYEKGRLRIAGKANDAAMLVNAIESQEIFRNTSFAAASIKDDGGKESFDLTTTVDGGGTP